MSRSLGLDVGTNSVGWCLVEDGTSIVDWGVYLFPEGAKIEKGVKEISKNAGRQIARTARRRYHRYKLRRKRLKEQLAYAGLLPVNFNKWSAREVYGLRAKGLDQKLEKEELGRVLLHLNRRRGFRSGRKEEIEDKELRGMKEEIHALQQQIDAGGFRSLGEYFYSLFTQADEMEDWRNPDEPIERIRKRHTSREMYLHEFDLIWEKQRTF